MFKLTDEEFERAVDDALQGIPERFLEVLDNITIFVQDEPDEDQSIAGGTVCDGEILGLYEGVSLDERADGYIMDLPDIITVFKGPHERCFDSREQIVDEIGKTVIHELGHYFGLDDERLQEMGY